MNEQTLSAGSLRPADRKVWAAPRLVRLGTIADVSGANPPTINQTAASKS